MKDLTPEEIDKHIESIDLKDYQLGGKYYRESGMKEESVSDIITKICPTYKMVRPILVLASKLLKLIKPKWSEAIDTFIRFMDTFCP